MVPLIIFYLHIIGISAAFTSEYQKEDASSAFLSVGFIVLIFSVGWTISTFVLKYVMSEAGYGLWLNRDACSLLLLTIGEAIFYYNYYKDENKQLAAK
jgi:ABC-type transport system involved in multi-copper enzyme maturation permease subunit